MSKLSDSVKLLTAAVCLLVAAGDLALADELPPSASIEAAEESEPVLLELGPHAGAGIRTDDEAAYRLTQRAGLLFGVSVLVSPAPSFGFGLSYDHLDLGRAEGTIPGVVFVDLSRDLSSLWLDARIRPFTADAAAISLTLGPGLSWQSADARGALLSSTVSPSVQTVQCEGADSAALSVRGSLGGELRLSGPVWMSGALAVEGAALGSSALDGCVLGAGAPIILVPRLAFTYRHDISSLLGFGP